MLLNYRHWIIDRIVDQGQVIGGSLEDAACNVIAYDEVSFVRGIGVGCDSAVFDHPTAPDVWCEIWEKGT